MTVNKLGIYDNKISNNSYWNLNFNLDINIVNLG